MSNWKIWLLGILATVVGLVTMVIIAVLSTLATAFLIGGGISLIVGYTIWEKSKKIEDVEQSNERFWEK